MVRSPIHWIGGKSYMATWIISRFGWHDHYVVVFAGGLHTLMGKHPVTVETVNDLDEDLINFWLVCRDNHEELVRKVRYTPYSRSLYLKWKNEARPEDPVDWAARWFFLNACAFNGANPQRGGWSYQRARHTVNVAPAEQLRRRTDRIEQVVKRLSGVQIECCDFRVMFERFAGYEDNLMYCDPPYPDAYEWYKHNFENQDHFDLADLANKAKAKVAISYPENALIRELYDGWTFHEFKAKKHCQKVEVGETKDEVTELLICNYEMEPLLGFMYPDEEGGDEENGESRGDHDQT